MARRGSAHCQHLRGLLCRGCLCLGLSTDWKSEALQLLIKWRTDSFQFDITLRLCMFPYIGHFQIWSFHFGGKHDNNIDGLFGPQTNSLSCRGLIKQAVKELKNTFFTITPLKKEQYIYNRYSVIYSPCPFSCFTLYVNVSYLWILLPYHWTTVLEGFHNSMGDSMTASFDCFPPFSMWFLDISEKHDVSVAFLNSQQIFSVTYRLFHPQKNKDKKQVGTDPVFTWLYKFFWSARCII